MTYWEYLVVKNNIFGGWELKYADRDEKTKIDLEPLLNQLGAEGWELTAVTHNQGAMIDRMIFKRARS